MQAERPVTKKDLALPPSLLDPRQHAEAVSGLSEEHIAQALTVIEHRMFVDIQVSELLQQAWSKPKLKHKAPNVVALITRFNALSLWFVYAILAVD